MKKIISVAFMMFIIITSYSQKNSTKESINSFSFKLFDQVYTKNENCFFSPFSIYSALSMTYAGAKNNTKDEMERVLEISNSDNHHSSLKGLTASTGLNREFVFLSSNSIWLEQRMKMEREYTKEVEENYQAKCKSVDFTSESDREKVRKEINAWVEKKTSNNILEFIKPGVLSESTSMLLVNAVYFNAIWETEFLPNHTKDDKFLSAKGDSVNCKMMNANIKANYHEDELAQIVEIPYEANKASLLVILPRDTTNSDFTNFNFQYVNKSMELLTAKEVKLSFPAFKMDVDYDLADVMKKMGMKSAFEYGADFSGITGKKDLIISSLLHKSVIDVSEKGTKASSTTAVIASRSTSVAKEPVTFKANHPFIFLIRDNTTGVILFMGYMANPK